MAKSAATIGSLLVMTAALSGCASTSGPNEAGGTIVGSGLGALTGGLVGGALGGSGGAVVGAVTGGVLGGVTGNAIGRDLDERDRQLAMDAEMGAFETGRRRPWRGARGTYGYVEPGPEYVDATPLLRTHIANLRRKLQAGSERPRFIRTDSGIGYRFAG